MSMSNMGFKWPAGSPYCVCRASRRLYRRDVDAEKRLLLRLMHTPLHAPRLPLDITIDVSAKNLVIIDTHVPFSRSFRHILVVSVKNRRKIDTHIPF